MTNRRQFVTLLAATPFLSGPAWAQDKTMIAELFKQSSERIRPGNALYVRQQYAALGFYIELLRAEPPRGFGYEPRDLDSAQATRNLLFAALTGVDVHLVKKPDPKLSDDLMAEYERRQERLWAYLKQTGIEIKSPADRVLETAMVSMMLFYALATSPSTVTEMRWCIFPFCFARPA